MDYLPIFLDIRDRQVLIDGGGSVATRRAERALAAGASVTVFDPAPCAELLDMQGHDRLDIHLRPAEKADIDLCRLAYGASEDRARDDALHSWCRAAQVLCNVADLPEHCDFITPSIVDRSPIVVAISTGGTAPVVARILRARIEATLPAAFGRLAAFASGFRAIIAKTIDDGRSRRHFWERMIEGPAGDFFLSGAENRAKAQIIDDLEAEASGTSTPVGEVYLVGAGPGDPDLLTFKALRLMQRADVVLYDRLVGDEIMSLVRRDAERIYVGKLPTEHTLQQEDISKLMVKLAKQGNRVLRLKGGDPYIFGRGGEEIQELAASGIGFQVVPGITAASGSSTYAGIPLTHRDHAQSCTFVTAHGKGGVLDLDWDALIRKGQTVAVYMGLSNLPALTQGFAERGVDMTTPVAVIENGTRPNQRVITASLAEIADRSRENGLKSPAMIIIGSVVTLREQLSWTKLDRTAHAMSLSSSQTPDL